MDTNPKPREYNQVKFRSTLEAKWAIFFDDLGWRWQYEPFKLKSSEAVWEPDFVIEGNRVSIFCEVKPSASPQKTFEIDRYCQALNYTNSKDRVLLLLGDSPLKNGEDCQSAAIGWMIHPHTLQIETEMFFNGTITGLCDEYSSWVCKITGEYDSQILPVPWEKINRLWISASIRAEALPICEPPEHPQIICQT